MSNQADKNTLVHKLEQLRNSTSKTTLANYQKRAKAKYVQQPFIKALIKLDSNYKSKYESTENCSSVMIQTGNTITSRYCKHRWCRICNRIRTGKLINGYKNPINAMSEKRFVTLTIPNCKAEDLRNCIDTMNKNIRLIQDLRRKKKQPLINCIRKLECTYNPDENTFHPHFHFILEGEQTGKELIEEWLKRYPKATHKAQDERIADNPQELFKYFAKLTSKSKNDTIIIKGKKAKRQEYHYPEAMDFIFQTIEGMRIIQPMGNIKMVSDEIEEIETQEIEEFTNQAKQTTSEIWIFYGSDWYNPSTGELLTLYEPTPQIEKYSKRIRYLHNTFDL
jgi:hypothetical protein